MEVGETKSQGSCFTCEERPVTTAAFAAPAWSIYNVIFASQQSGFPMTLPTREKLSERMVDGLDRCPKAVKQYGTCHPNLRYCHLPLPTPALCHQSPASPFSETKQMAEFHIIIEWLGLEGTVKGHLVQPCCREQGLLQIVTGKPDTIIPLHL